MAGWYRARAHSGGWLAILGIVILADMTGDRTMSQAFRDLSRHPVGGPVVLCAWGIVTAHLFGVIPSRYDPLNRLCRKWQSGLARLDDALEDALDVYPD